MMIYPVIKNEHVGFRKRYKFNKLPNDAISGYHKDRSGANKANSWQKVTVKQHKKCHPHLAI